jgi:pyruvate/2-oxoacid:ferredoxin oxidoreductase alpha subunit
MHEMLHWATGARLPIVMAEVNRALGPGWNLWVDQTDSLSQRDTGWLQLYCADGQEALDTTILAYKLAETINLPVMVILDAFFLSHTYEPVDVPEQADVDKFLPAYEPKFRLDTSDPCALNEVAPSNVYMEMRRSIQAAMEAAPEVYEKIENEYFRMFGRRYGLAEPYRCEDAETILVMAGTAACTARVAVDALRAEGEKVGLLRIKMFRPFPARTFRMLLSGAKKVAVLDRNCSFGAGGIFAQEIKSALFGPGAPKMYSYIAGMGGRDVTVDTVRTIYSMTRDTDEPVAESLWLGLNEEMLRS